MWGVDPVGSSQILKTYIRASDIGERSFDGAVRK